MNNSVKKYSPEEKFFHFSLLCLHIATSILLLLHWYVNEDECALTSIESYLRGVPSTNSFIYDLVSPVYKINDENLKQFVTIVTVILGSGSVYQLYKDWHNYKK